MKELYKALFDFQQDVPNIYKNAKGYGYSFADLGEINEIIKPILKKHGLGYIQPLQETAIQTIVFHVESGESIESLVEIPQRVQLAKMNEFQVMGSAITYLRRYSLSSMLGLITDEDADAAGEQVKKSITGRAGNPPTVVRPPVDNFTSGADQEIESIETTKLKDAKRDIKAELVNQGYDTDPAMQNKVKEILGKPSIDSIDDAHVVAEVLDNER